MRDKTHIGLINPHAERNRSDHNHILGRDKIGLRLHPGYRLHPGMIKPRRPSGFGNQCRQFFCPVTRGGINNPRARPSTNGGGNR